MRTHGEHIERLRALVAQALAKDLPFYHAPGDIEIAFEIREVLARLGGDKQMFETRQDIAGALAQNILLHRNGPPYEVFETIMLLQNIMDDVNDQLFAFWVLRQENRRDGKLAIFEIRIRQRAIFRAEKPLRQLRFDTRAITGFTIHRHAAAML